MTKRVVLAMSGGVDSSVAAVLLRDQGCEVIGLFMRSGVHEPPAAGAMLPVIAAPETCSTTSHKQGCCSAADAEDARRVADKLDIPFYAIDFHNEFDRIMDYFADEYVAGRTPNPCVVCNNWLKFGKLWEYARRIDADFIATGHYAQIAAGQEHTAEHSRLLRAVDIEKDQSYVLFGLRRDLLSHVLFPAGGYRKSDIRRIADRVGLRVANKPDSQEICFITRNHYSDFVRRRRPGLQTDGEVVDTSGRVLGRHDGLENFTVGQRRGLKIAMGTPYYVVALEPQSRRVVLGTRDELACDRIRVQQTNWLVDPPDAPFRCHVKVRYRHTPTAALLQPLPDDRVDVRFERPQFGVAPGQAAVFYDGDQVLGGGWIDGSPT